MASPYSPAELTNLRDRARDIITDDPHTWHEAWERGATPWDFKQSQPPLRSLLESEELDLPATGKALVPGCGAGYDAIVIGANLGYDVLGLDISSTAVEKGRSLIANDPTLSSKVQFKAANFFELDPSNDQDRYDLIYDYAFFVAFPPSLRPSWGTQMNKLVKQGGHLVTLVSPINPYDENDTGAPYYVRPEHYPEVLGDGWEKVVDRDPEDSAERFAGRQRLVVWRKLQ
ncbi:hypothetical protein AAF712_013877 [Marasmius tenuissimus]|uniref:Thiol methyltransferase 1 n=1 Tax=Marasmius tenuissimus TaxID=585030 RepID=A0ABR2ZCP2_9AGAR